MTPVKPLKPSQCGVFFHFTWHRIFSGQAVSRVFCLRVKQAYLLRAKMCSLDGVQLPSKMWPDHKDFNFRYDVLLY